MKFTLIPTLALLCVAAISRVVSADDVAPHAEVPKENVATGTTGTEGAIYMGKDAQGNPIYAGNKVNYGTEGATMMMVSRDALFNMVASTCEMMANANPMMADWMQRAGSQNIEVSNECSVQAMKNWWDALCGEYSRVKQRNFRSGAGNQVVRRDVHSAVFPPFTGFPPTIVPPTFPPTIFPPTFPPTIFPPTFPPTNFPPTFPPTIFPPTPFPPTFVPPTFPPFGGVPGHF